MGKNTDFVHIPVIIRKKPTSLNSNSKVLSTQYLRNINKKQLEVS